MSEEAFGGPLSGLGMTPWWEEEFFPAWGEPLSLPTVKLQFRGGERLSCS